MLASLARLHHRSSSRTFTNVRKKAIVVVAASFATATACIVYNTSDDDEEEKVVGHYASQQQLQPLLTHHHHGRHPLYFPMISPIILTATTTCCDAAALLPQQVPTTTTTPTPTRNIMHHRLRRMKTVQRLQETATKEVTLEDKYKVQWHRPLGEGAYGAVYLATSKTGNNNSNNSNSNEVVAVKQMKKQCTDTVSFQREMDALMLLKENGGHPNICGMREHFEESDTFYIVMDFIGGGEMFDHLIRNGAYSEADAAYHVQQCASALAFLHGTGIVHCDIKPENLMLSSNHPKDAVIKVVDLGCAHFLTTTPTTTPTKQQQQQQPFSSTNSSSTRVECTTAADEAPKKSTASTPAYCPPEVLRQWKEDPFQKPIITPAFDMWSLGVVLYIMLIGAHPFDLQGNATNAEIEQSILSGKRPPLRNAKFAQHVSADAMDLIEGLLESDPSKRFTAEQVLANRWVQGETATSKKIVNSHVHLRKYRTKLASTFFKTLLQQTDAIHKSKTQERLSILQQAFQKLDTDQSGYLEPNEFVQGGAEEKQEEENNKSTHQKNDTKLSFSDVSSLLAENIKNRYFGKDQVIIKEGDRGDTMYFINSGTVEVTTKDGFSKVREPGDFFGEEIMNGNNNNKSRFRFGGGYKETVRAKTPVHVLEVSRAMFQKYVASDEETFLSMAETERHRRRERAGNLLRQKTVSQKVSYSKGSKLFEAGQTGSKLFLVDDGEINLSLHGHKVRTLRKGELAGEHAAYHSKPYNLTAECVSDTCQVITMSSKVLHKLFQSDPSLQSDFRELLLRRDFKKAVCVEIQRTFPETQDEIRSAFTQIAGPQKEEVSIDRLREIVHRFDSTYSERDIQDMLISLDLNKSGSLTWKEFNRIFTMGKES